LKTLIIDEVGKEEKGNTITGLKVTTRGDGCQAGDCPVVVAV
jgi:hypothetical protein